MNNALIVEYDPFAMESRLYVVKDNKREQCAVCSNPEELAEMLVQSAYQHDIKDIKFHGPFSVQSEIRRLINDMEMSNYSCNNITVEGI